MSDVVVRRRRWPGLVWALPLAALLIAAWLGLRALSHHGVEATLDVRSADGVRPGDTHVTYNGLEIGAVSGLAVAPDGRQIRLTLRIDDRFASLLRDGTIFWVIGSKPNFTDLSSLRATFAGFGIGMIPGGGAPRRQFVAVDRGPAIAPGTQGTRFRLTATEIVSIDQGTSIYTHGWQVGTILGTAAFGSGGVVLDAFVRAPYDRLVLPGTHFWNASAVQLSAGPGGLEARLTSPAIAAVGGVSFETPAAVQRAAPAAPDTRFVLYPDSATAETAAVGTEVPYTLVFTGKVGELAEGAPVRLEGFTVGRVTGRDLAFDAATGTLRTPVTIALDPVKLHVSDTRSAVDAMMRRLIARGLRAKLDQSPPLVGSRLVTLDFVKNGPPAHLAFGSPYPAFPVANSGDVADLTGKASAILDKVDALPLAEIGANLRQLTGNVAALTGSPKLKDSLDHLDSTLATLDRTTQATAPKIGPLVDSLRRTADQAEGVAAAAGQMLGANGDGDLPVAVRQLAEASRSLRSLADYLSRHPEALLRGKKEAK